MVHTLAADLVIKLTAFSGFEYLPKQVLESSFKSLFTYEIKILELEFEFKVATSLRVELRAFLGIY